MCAEWGATQGVLKGKNKAVQHLNPNLFPFESDDLVFDRKKLVKFTSLQ